jgi:hypothetical protein
MAGHVEEFLMRSALSCQGFVHDVKSLVRSFKRVPKKAWRLRCGEVTA